MSLFEDYTFYCPYCNADNYLEYDMSGGTKQRLLQDCATCCQPIVIDARFDEGILIDVQVRCENE